MAREHLLIVEDDADIGELEKYILEDNGYTVTLCPSAEAAETFLRAHTPALVIIDLMLPGRDGFSLCRHIRKDQRLDALPIIIVSARSEEAKIVAGLELGADDYIVKPFSPDIFLARVHAVLRRSTPGDAPEEKHILAAGDVVIDTARVSATIAGRHIALTVGEFKLLELLLKRPGIVHTREQIVNALHGDAYPVTDRAVDVQIAALRRKLQDRGAMIETVRGIGYRWQHQPKDTQP